MTPDPAPRRQRGLERGAGCAGDRRATSRSAPRAPPDLSVTGQVLSLDVAAASVSADRAGPGCLAS